MSLQQLIKAQSCHVRQNYVEAVNYYTKALSNSQQVQEYERYDILIDRAQAYLELNDLQNSKQDIQEAIVENTQRYEAYYLLGINKFKQGNYQAALQDFTHSLQVVNNQSEFYTQSINIWIQKCKAELESKHFKIQPSNQQQQIVVGQQGNPQQQAQYVQSSTGKLAYKWYQTDEKVGITIKYKIDKKEHIKYQFMDKKLEFSFPIGEGRTFELNLDLLNEIVPKESSVSVSLEQIDIFMIKKQKKQYWNTLEQEEELIVEKKEQNQEQVQSDKQINIVGGPQKYEPKKIDPNLFQQQVTYPSSSQKKKDWSKIDKDLDEELKDQKEDPLNGLFKQIYGNADENTRKAMIKSYQTSGGTVLSTNWDEVKNKEYDGKDKVEAPKGQEWAQWNK